MTIAEKLARARADIDAVYEAGKAQGGGGSGYDEGYADGKQDGIAEGIEQGKEIGAQAEYDKLWDGVQNYGNRTNYEYAFFGESWNNVTFYPKYDIVLGDGYSGTSMLRTSTITNLKQRLEECGVVLNTSRCQAFNTMFYNSQIVVLPTIDFSNAEYGVDGCFNGCRLLTTIEKVIFSEKTLIQRMFVGCHKLQNVIFEGVIAKDGLDTSQCYELSKASIISIVNILSDTVGSGVITLSGNAVATAFETSEGAGDGDGSDEFLNLIATKPNWTIYLM